MPEKIWDRIIARLLITLILAIHVIIDASFLALCAAIWWALDRFVFGPLAVHGFDAWLLWGIRILTGIALLAAVANPVIEDIIIAAKQMIDRVRKQ
jgi:hypothetical protein